MRLVYAVFILLLMLMTSTQCQKTSGDWLDKGNALSSQGKYDEAIQAYDEAIKLDPTLAAAWSNKGLALEALGRTTEAEAAFAKAKEIGSN
jgi:tetratricopeptide (TPR) repeat protein